VSIEPLEQRSRSRDGAAYCEPMWFFRRCRRAVPRRHARTVRDAGVAPGLDRDASLRATAGVPEIQTSGTLAEPARRCCLPWKQQSSRRRARLSRVLELHGWRGDGSAASFPREQRDVAAPGVPPLGRARSEGSRRATGGCLLAGRSPRMRCAWMRVGWRARARGGARRRGRVAASGRSRTRGRGPPARRRGSRK
jgi:hypothetical protein